MIVSCSLCFPSYLFFVTGSVKDQSCGISRPCSLWFRWNGGTNHHYSRGGLCLIVTKPQEVYTWSLLSWIITIHHKVGGSDPAEAQAAADRAGCRSESCRMEPYRHKSCCHTIWLPSSPYGALWVSPWRPGCSHLSDPTSLSVGMWLPIFGVITNYNH